MCRSSKTCAPRASCGARIDGKVLELDEAPALEKNVKHSIEAVVDRVVVRPDQAQRLAESFETALKIGRRRGARHHRADWTMTRRRRSRHLFSARYACPLCGYSISELEPRLFSFNNPAGACPSCDGLGVRQFFDPARVVREPGPDAAGRGDPRLGPAQRRSTSSMLESLARHYNFDLDTPFETCRSGPRRDPARQRPRK